MTRVVPVPSRRTLLLAAAVAAAAMLVPLLPAASAVVAAALAALALLAVVDWLLRPRLGDLELAVDWPATVPVGRELAMRWTIRNAGPAAVRLSVRGLPPAGCDGAPLHCRDAALAGGASLVLPWTVTPLRRGRYAWPELGVGATAGLGLVEHRLRLPVARELLVVPGRPSGELGWILSRAAQLESPGPRPQRRLGGEWEFAALRDYVVGDEPRRFDWKASARRHRPVVREFETERAAETILAIDNGRIMGSLIDGVRKVDLAMTPLLDLAAVALQRGEGVGLLAFDDRPRVLLPPRRGLAQLHAMIRGLAGLDECQESTSYLRALSALDARQRRRSMIVVFTDFTDEVSAAELVGAIAALRRRHVIVFVAVGDPHLRETYASRRAAEAEVFERAVAGDLILERRRVLDSLERLGVHTLDAEPARISGPLINRFLALRLGEEL